MIEREAQGAFLSQWSLTFEVRKRRCSTWHASTGHRSRNGA